MRIFRLTPWIYPDAKGGREYHVHAMSRGQAAMGHDAVGSLAAESRGDSRVHARWDSCDFGGCC